jgi:soluble lytic murein transglycosylase-like protein
VRRGRAALAAVLALAMAPPPASAAVAPPRLGVPLTGADGAVRWTAPVDTLPAWARGLRLPALTRADSLALWRAAAARPGLAAAARHRLALLHLAAGDTASADSLWAAVSGDSPWTWPALRGRAELALARDGPARADSILEHADRAGWGAAERAAWLVTRVRMRALAGDTARAEDFARQAMRVYPSVASTRQAVTRLEEMLRARGTLPGPGDERAAAEVEALAGRAAAAASRLRRIVAGVAGAGVRGEAAVRLCEVLRSARHFSEAADAARAALGDSTLVERHGPLRFERARAELGRNRPDSALALYARASADSALAPRAAWEAARAAEDAGRREAALAWYGRASRGGRQAEEARFRAGLLHFAAGHADSAAACWSAAAGEDARFWLGVARRALGDTLGGDSLLRSLAAAPGYGFYRAAARDTLGLAGWGGVSVARAAETCESAGAAGELAAVGAADEAATLLSPPAGDGAERPGCAGPDPVLAGSRCAYAMGRTHLGVTLARRAVERAGTGGAAEWAVLPWAFPPAYESFLATPRDSVVGALEPALLYAVVMQESRFEPRARSRSDALGLMQLKLGTAADMAKLARDPKPTETALFDPERNVRYGSRYLAGLLRRCEGSVAAALCAYNAGPGRLAGDWRDLRARGGEALVCELASNPAAQDYAKRILGFRAAYRELRPSARP